jgi:hypothetical protein
VTRKIQPDMTKSGVNRNDPRLGGFLTRDSFRGIVASPDADYDPRPVRNAFIAIVIGVAAIIGATRQFHLSSGAVYILLLVAVIVAGIVWNRS